MTDFEILAVIRERIASWRSEVKIEAKSHLAAVIDHSTTVILDDLDPDRIDAKGKMREELVRELRQFHELGKTYIWPSTWWTELADALLKKGWRK